MTKSLNLQTRIRRILGEAMNEIDEILKDPDKIRPRKRRPMRGRVLFKAWDGAIGISVWWDREAPDGVRETTPLPREERLQSMIDNFPKPLGRDTRRQHCQVYLDKFIERGMFKKVMVDGVEMLDYVPGSEKVINVPDGDEK